MAEARSPDVSVLVPLLGEADIIRDTAAAMLKQPYEGEIEYLFLDGGSRDGTLDILSELSQADQRVRVIDNPGRRQCRALNIGLREARGDVVVRMDAHTFYPPDYIALGVARLERGDVACVAGPQLPYGDGEWSRRVALAMLSPLGVGGATFRRELTEEIETDTAFTGMWPRQLLEDLGGWDEEALVNEDGELAARIRAGGGRIVCVPAMAARCVTRDSIRGLAKQYYRYGWDRVRTLRRHPNATRRSHALPPALVLAGATAVLGRGGLARAGRASLALYVACLALEAGRLSRSASPGDASFVPAILATMHFAWGTGFLVGSASHGAPVAALWTLTARRNGHPTAS